MSIKPDHWIRHMAKKGMIEPFAPDQVKWRRDVCETSYKDRGGKYQGQRGVTLPRV